MLVGALVRRNRQRAALPGSGHRYWIGRRKHGEKYERQHARQFGQLGVAYMHPQLAELAEARVRGETPRHASAAGTRAACR
jgi:hypothetical protein